MLQVEYVHYMIVGVGGIRPHRCSKYVIDYCLRVGEVTYAIFSLFLLYISIFILLFRKYVKLNWKIEVFKLYDILKNKMIMFVRNF